MTRQYDLNNMLILPPITDVVTWESEDIPIIHVWPTYGQWIRLTNYFKDPEAANEKEAELLKSDETVALTDSCTIDCSMDTHSTSPILIFILVYKK